MRVQQFLFGGLLGLACAQFPPKREGVKWLESKFHENVTISYKEVRGIPIASSAFSH